MPIQEVIDRAWRKFVAEDARLSRFDPVVLEGVRRVFSAGMAVGMRTMWQEMQQLFQPTEALCGPQNN